MEDASRVQSAFRNIVVSLVHHSFVHANCMVRLMSVDYIQRAEMLH